MTSDRSTLGALALNKLVQLSKCALSDDNCAGWDVANLRIRGLSAEALADLRAVLDRNSELESTVARLREALEQIVNVLGPDAFGCTRCCRGCEIEGEEALAVARAALAATEGGAK